MRRLRFQELTATAAVAAKLATKHGVRLEEVEETVFGRGVHIRKGQAGLYLMYGRTAAGRYLFCLIAAEESKATSRDGAIDDAGRAEVLWQAAG